MDLSHIQTFLAGAGITVVLAYAARTFPVPENKYGRWLVGVLQFALSNVEHGRAAMAPQATNSDDHGYHAR